MNAGVIIFNNFASTFFLRERPLRKKTNILFFLALQFTAVALITLGSLINFHQYKIWGKPLIPQIVGYKRDLEKSVKILPVNLTGGDNNSLLIGFAPSTGILPEESLLLNASKGSLITLDLTCSIPGSINPYRPGLRAPPAC